MKIVVTEPMMMSAEVKTALNRLGAVVYGPFDTQTLTDQLADCDVLMVRLGLYIGETLFVHAPKLRFVITATTGLEHIDLEVARARGIRIISLRDCTEFIQNVTATAEHSFGLLLSLVRHTPSAVAHVLNGGWNRNLFWGTQLSGKTLGIIGHGRIGAMVARYGGAIGMKVVACDTDSTKIVPPACRVSLEELMETSDVVSVHVSATSENRYLIDRDLIFRMKPGAWLINTARGSIVDNAALADAVILKRLAGVAVDVLEGEEHGRIDDNPLLDCARNGGNVLITPHIGGATVEAIALTEAAVVKQLCNIVVADNKIGESP